MGASNSNTGVGIVDQTVNAVANQVVTPVVKNVERQVGSALKETAYAVGTGDFNNYGTSLLKTSVGLLSQGAINIGGETGTERKAKMLAQQASDQAASDAQAAINETNRQTAATVAGAVGRRASSGYNRARSLITSSNPLNTLLTISSNGR